MVDDRLQAGLSVLNIACCEKQYEKINEYVALLEKWNAHINLIGASDRESIIIKHILDSLSIFPFIAGQFVLDVGTGAGLPGIPLAIVMPDKQFYLVDAREKRVIFLRQVITSLSLKNVTVFSKRVEALRLDVGIDTVTSRAVSDFFDLRDWSLHLLAQNGRYVLMKGPICEEIDKDLGGWLVQTLAIQVPFLSAQRQVFIAQRS